MSGIYWLASYPKSGNTWLRAFLTNYRRDSGEPASINDLDGGWASFRETFDECTGLESSGLTQTQIEHYLPSVHEELAARSRQPLFLKTHDAYTHNADGRPIFSTRATTGVVYLIRNPLDVVCSYAHHRNESINETIRLMNLSDATLASGYGLDLPQKLLSWSGHVRSWTEAPDLNIRIVRYEDLLRQPTGVFTDIVRFLRLDVLPDRIRRAAGFSCFDQLRSQEAAHGFCEKQPTASSFFRQGRAGAWREQLNATQVRQVVTDHGEVMKRFGYLGQGSDPCIEGSSVA